MSIVHFILCFAQCVELYSTEPELLNFLEAQKSFPRNQFSQLMCLAGWYENPVPTRFLAPIDLLKISALEF
jgi:hypothetical protein